MRIYIDGNTKVNRYYVQTLCMVFFPNVGFSEEEPILPDTPILRLAVDTAESGEVHVACCVTQGERTAASDKTYSPRPDLESDRFLKITIGDAVVNACGELIGYRPAWGILTGVRPSKVATEMLLAGISKTRVKRILTNDYFVIPKKAALAVDVALNERRIIGTPGRKDCSIYVSIPFCPTRCAYCSFVSYSSKRLLSLIPEYLERLCHDIRRMAETIRSMGLRVRTVYIGGGTPTILDEQQLSSLLATIAGCVPVDTLEEYTLEAGRPDTITAEKLHVAREYGISRISVNPQILCDEVLRGVGRCHTTEQFLETYELARNSGIRTINTDLIAGLPGDRFPTFSASFDKILALRPQNITVHTLSIKRAAELRQTDAKLYAVRGGDTGKCVDYSQIKAMHEGYKPYYMYRQKNTVGNFENVGLALDGYEGYYNIYMMEEVHSIFAAGAGAVTKLVDYAPTDGGKPIIERLFNPKYPYEYLREDTTEQKAVAAERFYREHGML